MFVESGEPDLILKCDSGSDIDPCAVAEYPVTITLAPSVAESGIIVTASFPDRERFAVVSISAPGRPVPYVVWVRGAEVQGDRGVVYQSTMASCPSTSTTRVSLVPEGLRLLVTDDDTCPDSVRLSSLRGQDRQWILREHVTTDEPTPPPGLHSLRTRTGVSEVDRVIEYVDDLDVTSLLSLMEFSELACSRTQTVGGVPCLSDDPHGTIRSVFIEGACSPGYFGLDDGVPLEQLAYERRVFSARMSGFRFLYAVFAADDAGGNRMTGIVFPDSSSTTPQMYSTLFLNERGRLVEIRSCGQISDVVPAGADLILAPVELPQYP